MFDAYERLLGFVASEIKKDNAEAKVFSTNRLVQAAGAVSPATLAYVLSKLVQEGWLEQFLRVETLSGRGIEDFSSLADVPEEVYDWPETHENIRVTPNNLRVYYKLQNPAH
ncbi:hypothetical protein [Variovorax paradoxus]|uniref:Uncharacterized protein n=1 Tax=Variovorax paradoxus TaxID=34073 RepID=A0A679JBV1_VARPD|nr:hypothetical protein VVAX_04707 [Variovorax paradoxus]